MQEINYPVFGAPRATAGSGFRREQRQAAEQQAQSPQMEQGPQSPQPMSPAGRAKPAQGVQPQPMAVAPSIQPQPNRPYLQAARQANTALKAADFASMAPSPKVYTPGQIASSLKKMPLTVQQAKTMWDNMLKDGMGLEGYDPRDQFGKTLAKYGVNPKTALSLADSFTRGAADPNLGMQYMNPGQRQQVQGAQDQVAKAQELSPFSPDNVMRGADNIPKDDAMVNAPVVEPPSALDNPEGVAREQQRLNAGRQAFINGKQRKAAALMAPYTPDPNAGNGSISPLDREKLDLEKQKLQSQAAHESRMDETNKANNETRQKQFSAQEQQQRDKAVIDLKKFYTANPSLVEGFDPKGGKKLTDDMIMRQILKAHPQLGGQQASDGRGQPGAAANPNRRPGPDGVMREKGPDGLWHAVE